MSQTQTQPPVMIVGAGPVGLSLALALARAGVHVDVFEAEAELQSDLRGGAYHPPTLEQFADWGVLQAVLARGLEVRSLAYWERATRERVAEFDYASIADATPYPFRVHCMQHVLCRILRDALATQPTARLHMQHRLVGFVDHGATVEAEFETPGGRIRQHGAWLCGADGAHSAVRKQLGMGFAGSTHADRFLVVNGQLREGNAFAGMAPVNYVFDPDEWVILLQLPGFVRVAFRAAHDEDDVAASTPARIIARLERLFGSPDAFAVESVKLYKVHERAADSFRRGRVVLLGDAAHINNPAGGMGLNSGIHDAASLAAVLRDPTDAAVDAWAEQRRRVAVEQIQARAAANVDDLAAKEAEARERRNRAFRAAAADPELARQHLLRFSMLAGR